MQKLEDVRGRGSVNDRGRDELVHGLVVRGFGGVMYETSTTTVDCTTKEGHANGFLLGYSLKSADEVCTLKILNENQYAKGRVGQRKNTFDSWVH